MTPASLFAGLGVPFPQVIAPLVLEVVPAKKGTPGVEDKAAAQGPGRNCPRMAVKRSGSAGRQPVKLGGQEAERDGADPGKSGRSRHRRPGTLSYRFRLLSLADLHKPLFSVFAQSMNNRQLNPGRNSTLSASSTDCCRKMTQLHPSWANLQIITNFPVSPALTQLAGKGVSFSMELGGSSSILISRIRHIAVVLCRGFHSSSPFP